MKLRRRSPVIRKSRALNKDRALVVQIEVDPPPKTAHPAAPLWARVTASVTLSGLAFLGLFTWFTSISASPDQPATDQKILIFTDRPGVPLQASIDFSETVTRSGEKFNMVLFLLTVDASYQGDSVGVSIAFQGEGFRRPNQRVVPPIGNCSLEADIYEPEGISPTCTDSETLNPFRAERYQVVSATLNGTGNPMRFTLTAQSTDGWSSSGFSRTAFHLPQVGTGYGEPESLSPEENNIGPTQLFHPDVTALDVTYRPLTSDEKIEIVSPQPQDSDALHWSKAGNGSFSAHGSTVVLGRQEQQSNQTFLIGVLAGLVPLVGSWIYKQLGQPLPFRRRSIQR